MSNIIPETFLLLCFTYKAIFCCLALHLCIKFFFSAIHCTLVLVLLASKGCSSRPIDEEIQDIDDIIIETDDFAQPINLRALGSTQSSITLQW